MRIGIAVLWAASVGGCTGGAQEDDVSRNEEAVTDFDDDRWGTCRCKDLTAEGCLVVDDYCSEGGRTMPAPECGAPGCTYWCCDGLTPMPEACDPDGDGECWRAYGDCWEHQEDCSFRAEHRRPTSPPPPLY